MVFESTIQEVIQRMPSVKSFRVALMQEVTFKAGQFMAVTISVDGEEKQKYFTISSSPTQKGFIEFTKRITGSRFSQTLDRMGPGDWIKVNMPMGVFTFDKTGDKVAFVSGGIGVTPIHSMCRFAADEGLEKDMVLLYGNRSQEEIPFKEDFEQFQQDNRKFRVVHVLEHPPEGWQGHTGYITKEIIAREVLDFADRTFFVCGPPAMVEALLGVMEDGLQIPEEQIVVENFTGY